MSATLSRSDVLKPLAWLIGIVAFALAAALFGHAQQWVLITLIAVLVLCVILYLGAYFYCLFFDKDALRSETYSLNKMAIEHLFIYY